MKALLQVGLLFVTLLLFSGCENDSLVEAEESSSSQQQTVEQIKVETHSQQQYAKDQNRSQAFDKNTSVKLLPTRKYMIFIFTADGKYDIQLKNDIQTNNDLKKTLNKFDVYFISTSSKKTYIIPHNNKEIETSAQLLMDIYAIQGTPTLVFKDMQGTSILTVPGYIPPKQFLATLEFIKSDIYKNVDRKNGDIYKELKKFYIEKGILKEGS